MQPLPHGDKIIQANQLMFCSPVKRYSTCGVPCIRKESHQKEEERRATGEETDRGDVGDGEVAEEGVDALAVVEGDVRKPATRL